MEIDWNFWLLGSGALAIGAILLIGFYYWKPMGKIKPLKWAGWLLAVFGVLAVLGMPVTSFLAAPAQSVASPVGYHVAVTESESFVSVNTATHTISWLITFNTTANTFGSSSGDATITVTTAWDSGALVDSVANLACGASPTVTGATSPGTVVQYVTATGVYNELWTKPVAVTAYEDINVLVPYGNQTAVTCLITLDGAAGGACDNMVTGEIFPMTLTLGGTSWTLNFIAYNIHA